VISSVRETYVLPPVETVPIDEADGRVLAEPIRADRDYPPLARSIRDGFAIRAEGFDGTAHVIGEVRAGERFTRSVGSGEAVEIMTGAPVPDGADAIVMVEHVRREGSTITTDRRPALGEFVNSQGAEARGGDIILAAGNRLGFSQIAVLATVGSLQVPVYRKPQVAVLATGDEIVPVEATPAPHQIRNSNGSSIAAQVRRAGGIPRVLPVAPDEYGRTRDLIEEGLSADLLLLSGGVSAGKYDIVEKVLGDLGAQFFFDRVLIQPGQPLVFGRVRNRFFFGLPGNPVSTMVTFETMARAALELLSGIAEPPLPIALARLTQDFRHRPGLTRFLPAQLSPAGREITPLSWQGSSDVAAVARANCWLVADEVKEHYRAGDEIGVLLK
jgi:molybdopterin molybdotransferase